MPNSIRAQFEQLHRKIHQLIWLNGLCRGLFIFLSSILIIISIDWALNISDPVIRLLLGLSVGSFVVLTLWKHLVIPLYTPLSDFDLALKIERQHPSLKDRFSSSVQFEHQRTTPFSGSLQLRQAVIDDAYHQASQINFLELIDTQPVRKIMIGAAAICLFTASITALHPEQAMLGIHRVVFPFTAPDWPQTVELRILDENLVPVETGPNNPYQIVEGQNFRFFVENRKGTPPEDLKIEYQINQDQQTRGKRYSESLRIVSVPDPSAKNRDLGTGTLLISNKTLKLRVTGGDDQSMPWLTIIAVPPTTIQLQQVRLVPPGYTQKPVETLPAGVGNFKALVGTRVEFKASSNKLLKSVKLRVKDQEPIALRLDPDRKHFSSSFLIEEPGTYSYWFDVENDQGFIPPSPEHFEITAISDAIPEVYLEQPETDLQVTPTAKIPLKVSIQDDLEITSALIRYQKSSRDETLSRALRTDRKNQSFPLPFTTESSTHQSANEQFILKHIWNLSDLPLREGDRIIFRAEALDNYLRDVSPESKILELTESHIGTSISRVLTIVSPQYKANELANRHARLLEELTRVLKDQRLLHTEIKDVQHQLQRVGKARAEEIDTIKQVEMDQKRVASQLFRPRTGLEPRSKELINELEWNHIDEPAMAQRLSELNLELSQLNQSVFPQIQEQITQARKKLQSGNDSSASTKNSTKASSQHDPINNPSTRDSDHPKQAEKVKNESTQPAKNPAPLLALNNAQQGQQQVINRLDSLLKSLSQWQKTRDLVSELEEQIHQQSEIQKLTEQLSKKTITKPFTKLKLQEQADLEKLASRQNQQADSFNEFRDLVNLLNSQSDALTQQEQSRNHDAIDYLRKNPLPDEMKQIAEKLQKNQVGQAIQEQQKLQQSMKILKDIFKDQSPDTTDALIKKLKKSEQELSLLKSQQQDVLQKLKKTTRFKNQPELQEQLEKLAKREEELHEKLKDFEQQLKRLRLQPAAKSVQRARNRLSKIKQALQAGNTQEAQKQIQESLDDLEQAQRELAAHRKDAEESLAFEELEKLDSEIKSLIERQDAVILETIRLEQLRLSRGRWSRGQLKSLKQLFQVEQDLQLATRALALKLEAAPVFMLTLEKVADQLEIAVNRLDQRLTDQKTLVAEKTAKSKLSVMLQIMNDTQALQQKQSVDNPDSPEMTISQRDQISLVTQLKLLKLLQENILQRTRSFNNSIIQNKKLTPQQIQQRNALAKEQEDLSLLSMELLSRFTQPLADEPEKMEEVQK